ncbi:hypothetical protein V8C86DRAFT_2789817 [Haematococcus lacustris]
MSKAAGSQWAPLLYPCFQHFSAADSTVRALTQTQVALHEQRSRYEAMLAQSLAQQAESERQRLSQEDSLRALQARSSEAERLYKVNEQQLRVRLDTLLQQLAELGVEHERLQKQSGDQLQLLQDKAAHMAQACQGLQAECSQLQKQLRDAHSSVEARQAAEQRVAELEHSLQAVNTRTQRMLDDLGSKWHAAEAAERQVRQELSRAMSSLVAEEQARVTAQQVAVHAIREHRQMAAALEAERLINEPLRHTHHASTTMAHVMRSQAAPLVADRSRHPSTPGKHMPSIGQAPGCCPSGPKTAVFTAETPRAVRPASPVTYNRVTSRPDAPSAVGGQKLVRLSRAWATSTPTAGTPHPVFPDNIERHQTFYARKGQCSPNAGKRHTQGAYSRQRARGPSPAIVQSYYASLLAARPHS